MCACVRAGGRKLCGTVGLLSRAAGGKGSPAGRAANQLAGWQADIEGSTGPWACAAQSYVGKVMITLIMQ